MRSSVLILILLNKVEGPGRRTKNNNKISFSKFCTRSQSRNLACLPCYNKGFSCRRVFPIFQLPLAPSSLVGSHLLHCNAVKSRRVHLWTIKISIELSRIKREVGTIHAITVTIWSLFQMLDSAILWIDYEKSPFFLRETRANETRARVKIYLREKGETSRWGEFHARSRLARSTIAEEKWGLLVVYPLDKSLSSCYVLWKSVAFSTGWIAECKGIRGIPEPGNVCLLNPES